MRTKFFIDTEFIESGPSRPIELLSIGIVCEDGRTFYAVDNGAVLANANAWVQENVLPHLGGPRTSRDEIRAAIERFIGDVKPEFWGYYADYDWVVFCQIFGAMIDLPKGWPMYCRDLKQFCDSLGNPKLPAQESTEHNALNDAKWNKKAYEFLEAGWLARGKQEEWISTSERMPNANVVVQIVLSQPPRDSAWNQQRIFLAAFGDRGWYSVGAHCSSSIWDTETVTHWRPLPAAPTETGKG